MVLIQRVQSISEWVSKMANGVTSSHMGISVSHGRVTPSATLDTILNHGYHQPNLTNLHC